MAETKVKGSMIDGTVDVDLLGIATEGDTMTAADVADKFIVSDADDSNNAKQLTLQKLFDGMGTLTAETVPVTTDSVILYDASESAANKMTLDLFLSVMNDLTALGSADQAADYVMVYDTTAGAVRKVLISGLGASGGPSVGNNSVIRTNDAQVLTSVSLWADDDTVESVETGADTLTMTAHSYSDGQLVRLATTGTLPAGLAVDTDHYVVGSTTDTIQLSTSHGGSAINITDTGTGTHTVYRPQNGMTAGPVAIETGVTVTIKSGSAWTILGV